MTRYDPIRRYRRRLFTGQTRKRHLYDWQPKQLDAETALDGEDEVVAYQNGQDSYLLIQDGTDIGTTVKFEDTTSPTTAR